MPPLTNITRSLISIGENMTLPVAATSYEVPEYWADYTYHDGSYYVTPVLVASGPGSLLDASSMKRLRIEGVNHSAYCYDVKATNHGVIDLSGLETVMGTTSGRLRLWADGGVLELGNIDATRSVAFLATGAGGALTVPPAFTCISLRHCPSAAPRASELPATSHSTIPPPTAS